MILKIIWRIASIIFFLAITAYLDDSGSGQLKVIFGMLLIMFAYLMRAIMSLHIYVEKFSFGMISEFQNLAKLSGKELNSYEEEKMKETSGRLIKQDKFFIVELFYQSILYLIAMINIFSVLN